jgi:dihydropteroate synthase
VAGHGLAGLWERGRPAVVGVVNVTPDSFSDGGRFPDSEAAVEHTCRLLDDGADAVDVGGESTRPGAEPVPDEVERGRVMPVITGVLARRPDAVISVDTRRAALASEALAAGACLVNDVTAGSDPAMLETVARHGAAVILMHMRGEPRTMQRDTNYTDVVAEVHEFLLARACAAEQAGIAPDRIALDPGIGFGKDLAGNLRLLHALPELAALGYAVLVGPSRKSFIDRITPAPPDRRLPGTLASLTVAAGLPRALVRVHDVAAAVQFLTVLAAIRSAA